MTDLKTKLYTITGFLGSGKTTFLKELLQNVEGYKVGVIQNEFGKIGIDGDIIKKDGMELIEINRGSIFCSCLKLSFIESLKVMSDKGMDYLFVEGSGLADPSNIGEILGALEVLKKDAVEYMGSISLVDAVNFMDQLEDLEAVSRQVKYSQLAIISKSDLVAGETVEIIKDKLTSINPNIEIEIGNHGKIDFSYFDNMVYKGFPEGEDTTNSPDNKPKTLDLTYTKSVDKETMIKFLDSVKGDCFRIKGFFLLDDGWNQVDVVNNIIDFKKVESRDESSQLVFISKIGPKVIRPIFNNWNEIVGDEMVLR